MKKALVTGCDLNYLDGAEALLRSVARLHPEVERYCFAPAGDLAAAAARLGGLARVLAPPKDLAGVPGPAQVAVAKLFTPTIEADVATWIDSDAILCRASPELWEVEAGTITGVQDVATCILDMVPADLRADFARRHPEAATRKGMNMGLFALRPGEWKDLPELYERELAEGAYTRYPRIMDQPILNMLWAGRANLLPFSFNAHSVHEAKIPRDVRVVHYTGSNKPWMERFAKHEPSYYYWVRHGLGESRGIPLLRSRFRIAINAPRRSLGRALRRWGLLANPSSVDELRPRP